MRLDTFLFEQGLAESRTKAKTMIENLYVTVNGKIVSKASTDICDRDTINVIGELPYVSRGGLKLAGAIEHFGVDAFGKTALDVGASSGGFTDCLLQNGAKHVYAIDAGSGQMAKKLISDPRVTLIENYNARYMKPSDFPLSFDIVTMDVSFISQKYIIPNIASVIRHGGDFISLIKPQFEVGRAMISKGGIVRDAAARKRAVDDVVACALSYGFECAGVMQSPIEGGDGNIEFIAMFRMRCL